VRQLLDFARVRVCAGGTAEREFQVPLARLYYTGIDGVRGIEAGDVTILVGTSSSQLSEGRTLSVEQHRVEW
jgi:beta-glucosidase